MKKEIEEKIREVEERVNKMNLVEPDRSLVIRLLLQEEFSNKSPEFNKSKDPTIMQPAEKSRFLQSSDIWQKHKDSFLIVREISGKNKKEQQKKGILLAALGFKKLMNLPEISSDRLGKVCKNSGIDIFKIDHAFGDLNKSKLLIQIRKGSKMKFLTPKGIKEVERILEEE